MARSPNTHGGGANTNVNGLKFERGTSLNDALEKAGYNIKDFHVFKDGEEIGVSVPKYSLYSQYLKPHDIDYNDFNCKRWLPDEAFINYNMKTVYIIEKKYQEKSGSVDEKLPNCDFKKAEYQKLFTPLKYKVEFIYILNDWFKQRRYKDTLDYIKKVKCSYYFNELPLDLIGL